MTNASLTHPLTIGTRGSKLALTQTELIAAALRRAHPSLDVRIKTITTQGDRILDIALSKIGDKSLFVKELEVALLRREIDLAVHSAKDLPSHLPDGLMLSAFLPRGDPRDALVLRVTATTRHRLDAPTSAEAMLDALPHRAHVGTGSLRRSCQLRALRPDLNISDVRGNVDTRLHKLLDGQFDALILAAAGLERLGFIECAADGQAVALDFGEFDKAGVSFVAIPLPATVMLPAVAQGTLAIESRSDDAHTNHLLAALDDPDTRSAALAERALLRRLEGGCQVPIAALAHVADGHIQLSGLVGSLDSTAIVKGAIAGSAQAAEALGVELAEHLLDNGARALLNATPAAPQPRPLEGLRVLVTRAEGRNEGLAVRLREVGAMPVLVPLIAYAPPEDPTPLDAALRTLMQGGYDWLVLTSAATASAIKTWLDRNYHGEWPAGHVHIAAVGPATAEACVTALGQPVTIAPSAFTAEALAATLGDVRGRRVLLLNADIAKPTLHNKLVAAGAKVDRVIAYRTISANPTDVDLPALLTSGDVDAILFTSGSIVQHFVERLDQRALDAARTRIIVCIGPATAEAATELGLLPTAVATTATEQGLIEALIAAASAQPQKHEFLP